MKTATQASIKLISSHFFPISLIGVLICGSKKGERRQNKDEELGLKKGNTENDNGNVV